jgi:hypothetical protein
MEENRMDLVGGKQSELRMIDEIAAIKDFVKLAVGAENVDKVLNDKRYRVFFANSNDLFGHRMEAYIKEFQRRFEQFSEEDQNGSK